MDKECFVSSVKSTINNHMGMISGIIKTACSRLRLQSITSHENSTANRASVRLEFFGQRPHINPVVPKKGIEQAFASLYSLASKELLTQPTLSHY